MNDPTTKRLRVEKNSPPSGPITCSDDYYTFRYDGDRDDMHPTLSREVADHLGIDSSCTLKIKVIPDPAPLRYVEVGEVLKTTRRFAEASAHEAGCRGLEAILANITPAAVIPREEVEALLGDLRVLHPGDWLIERLEALLSAHPAPNDPETPDSSGGG